MEIEEFIEQDILLFLDTLLEKKHLDSPMAKPTVEPTILLTRDYEKEFFVAIEKRDFVQAKKIMESLKKEFDNCAPGTPDKAQLKSLLMALYEKFKNEVEAEQAFSSMQQKLELTTKDFAGNLVKNDTNAQAKAEPPIERTVIERVVPESQFAQRPTATSPGISDLKPATMTEANTSPAQIKTVEMPSAKPEALQAIKPNVEKPVLEAKPFVIPEIKPKADLNIESKPEKKAKPKQEPIVIVIEEPRHDELKPKLEQKVEPLIPAPDYTPLTILLSAAESALKTGDLKTAIYNYRESKLYALRSGQIPSSLVDRYRSLFASIKMAIADKKSAQIDWAILSPQADMDKQLLLQLEREKRKLDQLLHKSDFNGSDQQFKKMQLLARQISDRQKSQATGEKLQRIQMIIQELRQHGSDDEQRLMAVP